MQSEPSVNILTFEIKNGYILTLNFYKSVQTGVKPLCLYTNRSLYQRSWLFWANTRLMLIMLDAVCLQTHTHENPPVKYSTFRRCSFGLLYYKCTLHLNNQSNWLGLNLSAHERDTLMEHTMNKRGSSSLSSSRRILSKSKMVAVGEIIMRRIDVKNLYLHK